VNYIEYKHHISQRMIRKIISLTSDHELRRNVQILIVDGAVCLCQRWKWRW